MKGGRYIVKKKFVNGKSFNPILTREGDYATPAKGLKKYKGPNICLSCTKF